MARFPPQPPPSGHCKQPPLLRRLLELDTKLSLSLHKLFHSLIPSSLLLLLELSADFRFSFPIVLSLSLSPLSPPLLPFLSPLIFGLLLDLALVGLVKVIFRRRRPPYNPNMSAAVSADNFSFPSGHASRVFFVAFLVWLSTSVFQSSLVELRIGGEDSNIVETVAFVVCVWAAVTAFSRVLLGRHFLLDVFAGACLGVFEAFVSFRFFRFEHFLRVLLHQRAGEVKS